MTGRWNLHQLGWRAFQDLSATLLSTVFGQSLQPFEDGNDAGRDGAFFGTWSEGLEAERLSGSFVIQAKFSSAVDSTLSLSNVASELEKIPRLVSRGLCDVYILMTNSRVTGASNAAITTAIRGLGVHEVRIWDRTWISQRLDASGPLRRLVPRVYGLGDLTEILDERQLRQARSILSALGGQAATFVTTDAYRRSTKVLQDHGTAMLLGGPTVGKSVIAQMLTLGAIDGDAAQPMKPTSARAFLESWNPDSSYKRVYWIDDAFGELSMDPSLVTEWVRAMPSLLAARAEGNSFIFTSRDYIYREARALLKESQYRLWADARVEIRVAELTSLERQQILYTHVKLGDQSSAFKSALKPHLSRLAALSDFTPGLAFRLGNSAFTAAVAPDRWQSLSGFFERPSEYLAEILGQLSPRDRATLALIFSFGGDLVTPLANTAATASLLSELGGSLSELTTSLRSLDGTFVKSLTTGLSTEWSFAHPTIRQATNELLQTGSASIRALIEGTPIAELMPQVDLRPRDEIPAKDRGRFLAVGADLHHLLTEKFGAIGWASFGPQDDRWRISSQLASLLADRSSHEFRAAFVCGYPLALTELAALFPHWHEVARLFNRLHQERLLPEEVRLRLVTRLESLATSLDSVHWHDSRIVTDMEGARIRNIVRQTILDHDGVVTSLDVDYEPTKEPESYLEDHRNSIDDLRGIFDEDSEALARLDDYEGELDDLQQTLRERWEPEDDFDYRDDFRGFRFPGRFPARFSSSSSSNPNPPQERNVFDDVDE